MWRHFDISSILDIDDIGRVEYRTSPEFACQSVPDHLQSYWFDTVRGTLHNTRTYTSALAFWHGSCGVDDDDSTSLSVIHFNTSAEKF
jgi:hypothetical protein